MGRYFIWTRAVLEMKHGAKPKLAICQRYTALAVLRSLRRN